MAIEGGPLEAVVTAVHAYLKDEDFRKRKHLFNRSTADLVHVVELVPVEAGNALHIAMEVGIYSHHLDQLVNPDGTQRAWVSADQCHFRDPLPLRDPDDPERRGYHPAFAKRVVLGQLQASVVPFLAEFNDLSDLVAVVPKRSIWGLEVNTDELIRLFVEDGDVLRGQALLNREYDAAGPERRVELRALAASLPGLSFHADDDVEAEESVLAEWAEAEQERSHALQELVRRAPDAVQAGRYPEVLARPKYQVNIAGLLDGTRESLDELWRWLLAVFPVLGQHAVVSEPLEARYRAHSLLTTDELWLAELLAVYLARVLRNRTPGLDWVMDDNGHLGLTAPDGRRFDLLDRACLALLWVKQPPVEQAEHLRVEEINQLDEVLLLAESEVG